MAIIEPALRAAPHHFVPASCRPSPLQIAVHDRRSPHRADVEAFVAAAYAKHFGARLSSFMPLLFALHDDRGRTRGVVGCRGAGSHSLFLEQYTRMPIETLLRERLGVDAAREEIVEVGNLACSGARSALAIVAALVPFLIHTGFVWVVFTAADTVLGVLRRLDLEPQRLCAADASLLEDGHGDWGTYYDHAPTVMAGRLLDGIRVPARERRRCA